MNTGIETELRAVFEDASASVTPPPDLADRVRRATRRRTRAQAGAIAAVVIVATVSSLVLASGTRQHGRPRGNATSGAPRLTIPVPSGVDALTVSGSFLYIASGDTPGVDAALAAYDRTSGRLVRRVSVPAAPRALRVGPDGSVWLTFYPDQNGGGNGIWLLSPDLSRRSGLNLAPTDTAPNDVLPTGPDSAVFASGHALEAVHLPPPGRHGHATLQRMASSSIGGQGGGAELALVAGRVAVLQDSDVHAGLGIFLAGHPARAFVAGASVHITSMAPSDNGLWITTTGTSYPGDRTGMLIRLDDQLRPVTPRSISESPDFSQPEQVWAHKSTVWVTSGSPGHSLVCFTYHGSTGAIATVRTSQPPGSGAPSLLAATDKTIYVLIASPLTVVSYSVPAVCR